MSIKTISFLSGAVMIGEVDDYGDWRDVFFIVLMQHPETGERMAMFQPAVKGRDSQHMTMYEMANLTGPGAVGPSPAAAGLAKAYAEFVADRECVAACIKRYTTECGPTGAFIKDLMGEGEPPSACRAYTEENIIKGVFKPEIKEIKEVDADEV